MSSSFHSQQHRRRLVDEWRIKQAWRLLWAELARVVADADRALHDATRTLRESERTAINGDTNTQNEQQPQAASPALRHLPPGVAEARLPPAVRDLHQAGEWRVAAVRQESELTTMVGGSGGPLENDNGGFRTEQCSVCDGTGEYEDVRTWGGRWPVLCRACHGTGRITYRSAARAAADNQRDSTLEMVARQRDAMAAKNSQPATFTAEEQARLRFHRFLAEQTTAYEEDR